MYLVSVTRLHIRALRFLPMFLIHTLRSVRQVQRAPGYLGGWGSNEWPRGFWTATCWEDVASMRAFRNGEPHLTAMRKLLHWCDEASFAHWEQESPDLPDPAAAYRELAERGTLSKVANPSPRQRAGGTVGNKPPGRAGPFPPRNR
jgi:hypothetical protein